tara:strand:+ start:549 stop:701 length:153 start_codon:yes stop_codon:yes gene_type:complete
LVLKDFLFIIQYVFFRINVWVADFHEINALTGSAQPPGSEFVESPDFDPV